MKYKGHIIIKVKSDLGEEKNKLNVLDKYVDECEFRFNTRELSEINRFDKMLTLCNRRLTYNELISEHE